MQPAEKPAPTPTPGLFATTVRPVLVGHCAPCHEPGYGVGGQSCIPVFENVNASSGDWQYLYDGGSERLVRTTAASGGLSVPRREVARYLDQAKAWTTATACTAGSEHFADVHCADSNWAAIQTFYEHGMTAGCGGNLYCPELVVTRDYLSIFMLLAKHGSGYTPPACTGIFSDVACPSGSLVTWIEQAYREGLILACQTSPLKYCPTSPVTETTMVTSATALTPSYHPIAGGSTYTFRDQNDHVVTEFSGAFATRDNIFLSNVLVGSYVDKTPTAAGSWQFHATDHLGTVRLSVRGSDGATVESHKYWPYGDEYTANPLSQRLSFAAMERDTENSHFYDHARHHDFNLGRFVSPDKVGGRPRLPQTWNRYSYAGNNPLKNVDPDGLEEVTFTARAFIQQKTVFAGPYGAFKGDNRGFSLAPNASFRTQMRVTIETDPAKRVDPANPIVRSQFSVGKTTELPLGISAYAKGVSGGDTMNASASQSGGNVILNLSENVHNPLAPGAPGIAAGMQLTVDQSGNTITAVGAVSGSPSFEVNVSTESGTSFSLFQSGEEHPFGLGLTEIKPFIAMCGNANSDPQCVQSGGQPR